MDRCRWATAIHRTISPAGTRPDESGAVAVVVALVLTFVLIPVAALSIDLGQVYVRTSDLQAIADAAARAGAEQLAIAQRDEATPAGFTAAMAAARTQAVQTLCVGVTQTTDPWYASCSGSAAWAADGDPANGEVSLYAGVPDAERGFTTPGVSGTTATTALTGLRVVTPPSRVTFGLAGAFGQTHTDPQRAATAGIFTVLPKYGFFPMYLSPGDRGAFCTRSAPKAVWQPTHPTCWPSASPDTTRARGYLVAPRTKSSENSAATTWNTAVGFDRQHLPMAGGTATLAPQSYPSTSALVRDLSAGLFQGGSGVTARLKAGTCTGGYSASSGPWSGLEGAYLTDFVNPAVGDRTAFRTLVRNGAPPTQPWLSPSVLRCGRLAVVPVFTTSPPTPPDTGLTTLTYALTSANSYLRLIWLDDRMWAGETSTDRAAWVDWPGNSDCLERGFYWADPDHSSVCTSDLRAYTGYVLDPRLLPATVADADATNVLDRYVGSGMPVIVRLLRDVGDPPPR